MMFSFLPDRNARRVFVQICAVLGLLATAACGPAPTAVGFADPYEAQNRKTHQLNRALDRNLVRPVANLYGTTTPNPVRKGISNFASNLNLPIAVVNNILQFRIEDAGANTMRFLFNSTFGLGGLIDVATEAGLAERRTDFGETLHVWGAPEGNYIELPILGPSTSRDAAGKVVDTLANPLNFVIDGPERNAAVTTGVIARFGDRYEFADLVDQVFYESEDSYAQARLLYLQNRRFQLSGGAQQDYIDPYEDVYGSE